MYISSRGTRLSAHLSDATKVGRERLEAAPPHCRLSRSTRGGAPSSLISSPPPGPSIGNKPERNGLLETQMMEYFGQEIIHPRPFTHPCHWLTVTHTWQSPPNGSEDTSGLYRTLGLHTQTLSVQ